jgi:hypothetical protein
VGNDINLLGIEGWVPESNYVVYYINDDYECSGPGHDRIYITDLNGNKSFFDEYLSNSGTFDFNGNETSWLPVRIDWPIDATVNGSFLLSQHAPIPMTNSRMVTVENNEIKKDFNLINYDDPEYKNNMQRIRSNYDYNSELVVWDEKIHYFGSRWEELGSNESIQLLNLSQNEASTIIEAQTDLAYTNPVFIGDNKILYRRYNVEVVTNPSGYTYNKKSDDFDLFIYDSSDESNRMLIENIIAEDIHGYIASAASGWQTHTNDTYGLSFSYPSTVDIEQASGNIYLASGDVQFNEIGSSNAFLAVINNAEYYDQDNARLNNIVEDTITIAGGDYKRTTGNDNGRYEGDSAGIVVNIAFSDYTIHIEQNPGNTHPMEDTIALANQILSTFQFTN